MSDVRTSGQGDDDNDGELFDDFDPGDENEVIIHYDLSAWDVDDQTELAAALAEQRIPHAWGEYNELLVPERAEERADQLIGDLEVRLGVGIANPAEGPNRWDEAVEYDLADWPDDDRRKIGYALSDGGVGHRWDGDTLIVAPADEATVDEMLDAVERGDVIGELYVSEDDDPDGGASLTTFFLAGDRLARQPTDPVGVQRLLEALDIADPEQPPYGVERGLWHQACELAELLADDLGEGDEPDVEAAEVHAAALRDLLRGQI